MRYKIKILFIFCLISNWTFSQVAKIPFEFYKDTFVLFKAKMNNSKDSLVFYFDTGATTSLIDSTQASRNKIISSYEQSVDGAGGKKTYKFATNQSINLSNEIKLDGVNLLITDLSRLKKTLGKNFDGIIGYDILKNYITKIDFDKHEIELYENINQINLNEYFELNFEFKNGIQIPQFPISIELKNGEKYTGTVFFDSGAGITLLINQPFAQINNLSGKVGEVLVTGNDNLSTKSIQKDAVIKKIKIGKFEFGECLISLSDDKEGVSSYEEYLGILGNEIISRFNVVTDYKNLKIYLKPNLHFNRAFNFPLSGIDLASENDKIIVSSIVKSSVAYKKGLRENYQIVSINDIKNASLDDYKKMLKNENAKIKIEFIDNLGRIKSIKIKLNRLI